MLPCRSGGGRSIGSTSHTSVTSETLGAGIPMQLEEQYMEAEKEYWPSIGDPGAGHRQRNSLDEAVCHSVRRASLGENLPVSDYEGRLLAARATVDSVTNALAANVTDGNPEFFWSFPSMDDPSSRQEWGDRLSPVNAVELAHAAGTYLTRPWMQSNLLEWYLLNGFIFDALASVREEVFTGRAFGRINYAYLLGEGKLLKTMWFRIGLGIVAFVLRWVLVPAAVGWLFYEGLGWIIPWLVVPYGLYLLVYVASFPKRWKQHRYETKVLSRSDEVAIGLVSAYATVAAKSFSPKRLLEQIRATEGNYTFLQPVVHSILERAIDRDASLFTIVAAD